VARPLTLNKQPTSLTKKSSLDTSEMCPAFTQGDYDAFCWSLHVVAGNRSLSLPRYSRAYLGYNLPLRKPLRIHPKGSGIRRPARLLTDLAD
jgi:hypothetical protein